MKKYNKRKQKIINRKKFHGVFFSVQSGSWSQFPLEVKLAQNNIVNVKEANYSVYISPSVGLYQLLKFHKNTFYTRNALITHLKELALPAFMLLFPPPFFFATQTPFVSQDLRQKLNKN